MSDPVRAFFQTSAPLIATLIGKWFGITELHMIMQITAVITGFIGIITISNLPSMKYLWYRIKIGICSLFSGSSAYDATIYEYSIASSMDQRPNEYRCEIIPNIRFDEFCRYIYHKGLISIMKEYIENADYSVAKLGVYSPDYFEKGIIIVQMKNSTCIFYDIYEGHNLTIRFYEAIRPLKHASDPITSANIDYRVSRFTISCDSNDAKNIIKKYFEEINKKMLIVRKNDMTKVYQILITPSRNTNDNKNEEKSGDISLSETSVYIQMAKDTIFVSQEIEKNVFDSCERFLKSADEYKKVGDPWTLGFLLYGLPGTGKTSIIQVLAKEHGLDIFSICLSLCNTTNDIVTVFNSIRNLVLSRKIKSYIVALEDFDRSSFFTNEKISIDVFLNSINGIVPDSGRILFITCNDKAVIDKNPAIIRPGRIDIVAEIGIANEYQYVNCLRMYGIIKQTETTIPKGIPKGLTIAQLKEHIRRIAPELQKIK